MNTRTTSFSNHVDGKLSRFRATITLTAAALISVIFGVSVFFFQIQNDRLLVQAISQHVASLVEQQDRGELQRLLSSIKDKKGSDIKVIRDGRIEGTTGTLDELDRKAESIKAGVGFGGIVTALPLKLKFRQ